MSQELFLQKHTNNTFFGFLVNSSKVWDCFQRSSNPRDAVINYYKQLSPMSNGEGTFIVMDVDHWKVIAKVLKANLYVNYPHVSRILPSIPPSQVPPQVSQFENFEQLCLDACYE